MKLNICPECKKEIIGSAYNGRCFNCFKEQQEHLNKRKDVIIKRPKEKI